MICISYIYIIQQICKTYIWNIFIQMVNMQLITIHKHRSPLDLILESIDQALALRWALSYRRLPVMLTSLEIGILFCFPFFVNIPKDSLFGAWHRGWHPIIRTLTYFLAVNIHFHWITFGECLSHFYVMECVTRCNFSSGYLSLGRASQFRGSTGV